MIRRLFYLPLLFALAFMGCQSKPEPRVRADAAGTAAPVHTITVSQVEWPSFYDAVGTVRARTAAQVSARIMGTVRGVTVRVGDRVRQAQALVTIDAGDLEARERQTDAALAEAQSADTEAQSAIESARANLDLAQTTFRRMQNLHNATSISNQEFDESSARLRVATANLDMALSRRKQVASRIVRATEERSAARIQHGYSTIVAPFAGVVTDKTVEPGNMVTPGVPLLTIERDGAYRLEVSVEEANIDKVHLGQHVTATLDSIDRTLDATVSEIAPAVDASSRAFIAKVDLPPLPNVRSGLFGRVRFTVGSATVVAVPASAIVERGQIQWAFVADGNIARGRIVTLGRRYQDQVEILSGLNRGERIVAPAPHDLADGAKLEVRQ